MRRNPPDEPLRLNGRSVLQIEDDPIMLRALGQAFQRSGCRIVGSRPREEGMKRFFDAHRGGVRDDSGDEGSRAGG